jgi:hypothetical protein
MFACFRIAAVAALSPLLCLPALAEETPKTPQIVIEKQGNVTSITSGGSGWSGVIKDVQNLRTLPPAKDAQVIAFLTKNMDALPPAYMYELARRTCASDPDRALEVFGVAGMRIRYDIYRCVDKTAQAGLAATLMSLPLPACRILQDKPKVVASLKRLRSSQELFASRASPWWICSHGMAAISAGLEHKTLAASEWLKPEAEWDAIRRKIIDDIDYTIKKHSGG